MALAIEPLRPAHPDFAGKVTGLDIAAGVSAADAARLEAAMDHYAVLVLPGQNITDEQQYAFSQHFGPMEQATGDFAKPAERRLPMTHNDVSNLDKDGRILARDAKARLFGLGNRLWHSDSSFKPTPAKYSLLSARVLPDRGGNTEFADMRAAWDALDPAMQARCHDLVVWHSQLHSRGQLGFTDWDAADLEKNKPVPQRLVRRHEGSGRLSLYLSAHAGDITGWPTPETRIFLRDLTEHATQAAFVYIHQWQPFDLVMWDNRVLMHRVREHDQSQARDMRRTTVADRCPTLEQPL